MAFRSFVSLCGVIILGIAMSYLLQIYRTLGQFVGDNNLANQILKDRTSPEVLHGQGDVTLVIFTDYQCPNCRKSDPGMRAAVAKDGNIRVVYKDWPIFGDVSRQNAVVALASARQGIYPSVHHKLMVSSELDEAGQRRVIEGAGGNWEKFQLDEKRDRTAIDDQLAKNGLEALGLGLEGTPGYLVGPFLFEGALTQSEFTRAFAQARAERGQRFLH